VTAENWWSIRPATSNRSRPGVAVIFEDYETPKTEHGIGRVGAGRAAWFKDPDGNLIGVLEFDDPV
jgi:hypothetical protein